MKSDLRKHTLYLREGDWAFLESIYHQNGIPTSIVIRTLVSAKVDELKALEQTPQVNLEMEL